METELTIALYMGGYTMVLWCVGCILTLFWKLIMEFVTHYILPELPEHE